MSKEKVLGYIAYMELLDEMGREVSSKSFRSNSYSGAINLIESSSERGFWFSEKSSDVFCPPKIIGRGWIKVVKESDLFKDVDYFNPPTGE